MSRTSRVTTEGDEDRMPKDRSRRGEKTPL